MDQRIENLISEYLGSKWQSNPMEKALEIATTSPEVVKDLAISVMERIPEGGNFLDAALMFLPIDDWPIVVGAATRHIITDSECEAADDIIAQASLQCPSSVHPYLQGLFEIDRRYQPYYGTYAWRESGETQLEFLIGKLLEAPPRKPVDWKNYRPAYYNTQRRAFDALLETRTKPALTATLDAVPKLNITKEMLPYHFHEVDHEWEGETLRKLTPDQVFHLHFPIGYVERLRFLRPWYLPTWLPDQSDTGSYRFGGVIDTTCGVCGKYLHHMLTLPEALGIQLGVTSVPELKLVTCVSCLGWEEPTLYFQHGPTGGASSLLSGPIRTPEFPSPGFAETEVSISLTPQRWRWQDWAMSNSRENLFRLGGHPTWVQSADFPSCPACSRTMLFVMQLDSGLTEAEGDSHLWGSGGIAYFFWCDGCRISANLWQCT